MTPAPKPEHPGTIREIDVFTGKVDVVPADSVSPRRQFVMIDADGVETNDPALAVEWLPIVEVRVLTTDANGKLGPIDQATQMQILEYGENERLLRSTLMIKD